VEIMPIEYCFVRQQKVEATEPMPDGTTALIGISHIRKNPRLQIYWGYTFSPNLTQEIFDRIVRDFENKDKIKIQNNPDRFIVYQFAGKPKIYLDKLTKRIYVTRGTLNHYSKQHCQQQASYVLRILKGTGKQRETRPAYASFKRISVTCNPKRIGRTKEEREIYFEAVMDLFNDKPKVRLEEIRKARCSISARASLETVPFKKRGEIGLQTV
jgi:hypothetical protein